MIYSNIGYKQISILYHILGNKGIPQHTVLSQKNIPGAKSTNPGQAWWSAGPLYQCPRPGYWRVWHDTRWQICSDRYMDVNTTSLFLYETFFAGWKTCIRENSRIMLLLSFIECCETYKPGIELNTFCAILAFCEFAFYFYFWRPWWSTWA